MRHGTGNDTLLAAPATTRSTAATATTASTAAPATTPLGGLGNDTLRRRRQRQPRRRAGNDSLDGGFGNDTLFGGIGNDTVFGGNGDDSLNGGDGDDWLGSGGEFAGSDSGNNTLDGGEGSDILNGGLDSDTLLGGGGDDRLLGYGGNDSLNGGQGEDIFYGGTGSDTLVGGLGRDYFNYNSLDLGSGSPIDTFNDFDFSVAGGVDSQSLDVIDLSNIDPVTDRPGDQAFTLLTRTTPPTGLMAAGTLYYDLTNGVLYAYVGIQGANHMPSLTLRVERASPGTTPRET